MDVVVMTCQAIFDQPHLRVWCRATFLNYSPLTPNKCYNLMLQPALDKLMELCYNLMLQSALDKLMELCYNLMLQSALDKLMEQDDGIML